MAHDAVHGDLDRDPLRVDPRLPVPLRVAPDRLRDPVRVGADRGDALQRDPPGAVDLAERDPGVRRVGGLAALPGGDDPGQAGVGVPGEPDRDHVRCSVRPRRGQSGQMPLGEERDGVVRQGGGVQAHAPSVAHPARRCPPRTHHGDAHESTRVASIGEADRMSEMQESNRALVEEFRATHGKLSGRFENSPILLLTTTGRRTGRRHTTPMMYTRDGDRLLVYASNAGAVKPPDWYLNLQRERLFARTLVNYPFFADHERHAGRQIPVVALERPDA